jgi:hypothetical protein
MKDFYEAAVAKALGAAGRVNADDPQAAELALLIAAVAIGIHERLGYGVFGGLMVGRTATPVALGELKDFLAVILALSTGNCSRHNDAPWLYGKGAWRQRAAKTHP